jgi:hypothetical protein
MVIRQRFGEPEKVDDVSGKHCRPLGRSSLPDRFIGCPEFGLDQVVAELSA